MRSLYDDYLERIKALYTDNPSQIVELSISWLQNTLQSLYDAYKSVPPVPTIVERGGKKIRVKSDLSPVAVKDGKQIRYSVQDFYFFVEFVVLDTFVKDTSSLFYSCLSKPEPILYNLEGEEYDDQYKRLISKKDVLVERSSKEKIVPQYNREATLSFFKQEMDTYLWVQEHLDEYQEYDYATENKAEDCIKRMYEDYVRRVSIPGRISDAGQVWEACLLWVLSSLDLMMDLVADTVNIDHIRKNKPSWSDSNSLYFVLSFCVTPLLTMMAELLDNKQIMNNCPDIVDVNNTSASGAPVVNDGNSQQSNDGEYIRCFPKFVPGIEDGKQNNTVNLLNDLIIDGKRFGTNPGVAEFVYIALLVRSRIILNPSLEDLVNTYPAYTQKLVKNYQICLGNDKSGQLYFGKLAEVHWNKMSKAADYFAAIIPKDFMQTIKKEPKSNRKKGTEKDKK